MRRQHIDRLGRILKVFPFGGVVFRLLGVSRPGGAFADDWRGHVDEIRRVYSEPHLPIKVDRADATGLALDIRKVIRGPAAELVGLQIVAGRVARLVRITHRRTGPVGDFCRIADRSQHGFAARRRIHFQPGGNIEEQTACSAPSCAKLCIGRGIMRFGKRNDPNHCGQQITSGSLSNRASRHRSFV